MTALADPATKPGANTADLASPEGGAGASAPRRRKITKTPEQALLNVRHLGRTLDDLEKVRKSLGNRVGAMERKGVDGAKDVEIAANVVAGLEHQATLMLARAWRQHPLAPWAESIQGAGEKNVPRLISEIGDPTVRVLGERVVGKDGKSEWVPTGSEPRTLAQLRSYCGHGDPARRKAKGMSQDDAFKMGNPAAKMRLFLIAESGMKQTCPACRDQSSHRKQNEEAKGGYTPPPADCTCDLTHPLRHTYNLARAKYATRVYTEESARKKGQKPGEPWLAAHQDAAALREVGKFFLRELHAEASRLAG